MFLSRSVAILVIFANIATYAGGLVSHTTNQAQTTNIIKMSEIWQFLTNSPGYVW